MFRKHTKKIKTHRQNPTRTPCAQVMSLGQEFQYSPFRVYELGNRTKRETNDSLRAASIISKGILRSMTNCTKHQSHQAPCKPSTNKHADPQLKEGVEKYHASRLKSGQ